MFKHVITNCMVVIVGRRVLDKITLTTTTAEKLTADKDGTA